MAEKMAVKRFLRKGKVKKQANMCLDMVDHKQVFVTSLLFSLLQLLCDFSTYNFQNFQTFANQVTGVNSPKTVESRRKLVYEEDYPSLPTSSENTPGKRSKNISEAKVCVFTALKMKFSIKNFFINCEQIRRKFVDIS